MEYFSQKHYKKYVYPIYYIYMFFFCSFLTYCSLTMGPTPLIFPILSSSLAVLSLVALALMYNNIRALQWLLIPFTILIILLFLLSTIVEFRYFSSNAYVVVMKTSFFLSLCLRPVQQYLDLRNKLKVLDRDEH